MTNTNPNTNPKTTKPRRWFRFRLRTLLVMVTLLSVPLGWIGWELDQRRREKPTIAWVEEMGGEVYFYSRFDLFSMSFYDDMSWWDKTRDKWFGERVGGVSLIRTPVSDLSPLAELKNLHELHFWDELKNLHEPHFWDIQAIDLSPLSKLIKLRTLDVIDTRVNDLSPLAELKNLKMLGLRWTKVSDLSPLAELDKLEELSLANTPVSDLSPLMELKSLEHLYLSNTHLSEEQVQDLRLALPNCQISLTDGDQNKPY